MSGKPGRSGGNAKGVKGAGEAQVTPRLAELKAKVGRAAELIAGLREANHSLKSEVAELTRKVAALETASPAREEAPRREPESEPPPAAAEAPSRDRAQLELLLQERKAIRRKVESLLERVERLES